MIPVGCIERQVEAWGLSLDSKQLDSVLLYTRLLGDYDKANVIGTRDVSKILIDHVLDSLSCLLFKPIGAADSLIDIGSGGGLPGVPLKIALPGVKVSLLESNGKKASFLEHVVSELGLVSTRVLKERAEDLGSDTKFRERYEIATARALAPLSVLAEYCLPFVKVGGYAIAMKGRLSEDELKVGDGAAKILGGEVREVISVPFLEEVGLVARHLVILEKFSETPGKYPRRVGVPKKRPLDGAK